MSISEKLLNTKEISAASTSAWLMNTEIVTIITEMIDDLYQIQSVIAYCSNFAFTPRGPWGV